LKHLHFPADKSHNCFEFQQFLDLLQPANPSLTTSQSLKNQMNMKWSLTTNTSNSNILNGITPSVGASRTSSNTFDSIRVITVIPEVPLIWSNTSTLLVDHEWLPIRCNSFNPFSLGGLLITLMSLIRSFVVSLAHAFIHIFLFHGDKRVLLTWSSLTVATFLELKQRDKPHSHHSLKGFLF
jgi:hypothetical protein